ncbi:CYTH domain-containing protein [Cephalotus follicularis]|uniref:CYTH domain-containing protein n=1 Tax=Cephalotus follicularis TaxID=3775 RepID=A0A1Q3CZZ1_CEPFO|nr:CYTH domain-containing protein [Cephalotus follicularis]
MEVEVKLRLKDSTAHKTLTSLLSPYLAKTYLQENFFFDTQNSLLSSNLAALRIRFYDLDSRSVLSLKAQPIIQSGISRVEEQEESLDVELARHCVLDPTRLLGPLLSGSMIMRRVKEEFGVRDGFLCLGGFRNVRGVYEWRGLKLEIDETIYDFGTCYEVECESVEPERDREVIVGFLEEKGIEYEYSQVSKFAVFMSGKLPH